MAQQLILKDIPREKRERMRQIEEAYLARIDALKAEYRSEIRKIMHTIEQRKVGSIRKKLKA